MNRQLVSLVVAEHDLLWIPWRLAAKVDAAVLEFAATGRGYEPVSELVMPFVPYTRGGLKSPSQNS